MAYTLKWFVFAVITTVSAVVFLATTGAATFLYERLMADQAKETSRAIAVQTFNTMYEVMRRGWTREEMTRFIDAAEDAFAGTAHEVVILRGPAVEEIYGPVAQPEFDDAIRTVFATGTELVVEEDGDIRYIYPLTSRDECLACHANTVAGDVLGVIAVSNDLRPIAREVRQGYVIVFIAFATLLIALAALASIAFSRRIRAPMDELKGRISEVAALKDLRELDLDSIDLGFRELNEIFARMGDLFERMRNIAVDKDLLEFEIRVLGKFIITSDVVRDWKRYICDLLMEINEIVPAYGLFTLFKIEDEAYELDIFWAGEPAVETRRLFEEIIRARIDEHPQFGPATDVNILHFVADDSRPLAPISRDEIELQTKSLLLEAPRIGGVVGISMQSVMAGDSIRHILIDSILTTMLNVVGSVKAIYRYTKDLEYYATRDPLTNLFNQRLFWELLEYEIPRASRHGYHFTVVVIDMDNFKTVNDLHGHEFGDRFLQAFAGCLHKASRQGDIIARYGGDEFTLILPETDKEQAWMIAQRIQSEVDRMVLTAPDGSRVKATISIGMVVYPEHAEDARNLFMLADNMMYKAKRDGKNTVHMPTSDDMVSVFREEGEKNQLVMNAFDEGRIVPLFQPIVDANTSEIMIHELLMRIELDGRLVPAGEFIDTAERLGIVHKMDYMLIEKAFAEVRAQDYQGMLFINLSPKALIVGEFIDKVRRLARDAGIDPTRVVFEINERETVRNITLLEQFVMALKLEGFKFAIDDFGSGFSSFQYVKRFPIDYIKIEGEFIRSMVSEKTDMALVQSILALARGLGITTIAEYVEDEVIMNAAREEGIDLVQGYHIGRPSPRLFPRDTPLEQVREETALPRPT